MRIMTLYWVRKFRVWCGEEERNDGAADILLEDFRKAERKDFALGVL